MQAEKKKGCVEVARQQKKKKGVIIRTQVKLGVSIQKSVRAPCGFYYNIQHMYCGVFKGHPARVAYPINTF